MKKTIFKRQTKIKPGFRFIRRIRGFNITKKPEKKDWFEKQLDELQKLRRRRILLRKRKRERQNKCNIVFYTGSKKTSISVRGFSELNITTDPEDEHIFWR